jgi:hypothetical protein
LPANALYLSSATSQRDSERASEVAPVASIAERLFAMLVVSGQIKFQFRSMTGRNYDYPVTTFNAGRLSSRVDQCIACIAYVIFCLKAVGALVDGNAFAAARSYPVYDPILPQGVAVGDFDGDGKLDFITVAGPNPVFLGKGDGSFKQTLPLERSFLNNSFAVGDFNRDGRSDIALYEENRPNNYFELFLGKIDGTFEQAAHFPLSAGGGGMVVGDFDADGRLDLAFLLSGGIRILLGHGNGYFDDRLYEVNVGRLLNSITVSDFNKDGRADLALTGDVGLLYILLGGEQLFKPDSLRTVVGPTDSIAEGDFNNDGKPDLILRGSDYDSIGRGITNSWRSMLLGKGDGTFQTITKLPVENPIHGYGPNTAMAVADFDGDGQLDLALGNHSIPGVPDSVSILSGNGDGSFHPSGVHFLAVPYFLTVGDFNGDGKSDLAVVHSLNGDVVTVLLTDSGKFTNANTYQDGHKAHDLFDGAFMAFGDFDRDSKIDVAVAYRADADNISIALGNGDGRFRNGGPISPFAEYWHGLTSGDFNSDGNLDVVGISSRGITLMFGHGDGTFRQGGTLLSPGQVAPRDDSIVDWIISGDLNGDRNLDLVIANRGPSSMSVLWGDGTGRFRYSERLLQGFLGRYILNGAIQDIDRDGKLDVVLSSLGDVAVMFGTGNEAFLTRIVYTADPFPIVNSVAVGDLNNDGKADIAIMLNDGFVFDDSFPGYVVVLLGNGDRTFQKPKITGLEFTLGHGVLADFDQDGKLDLANVQTTIASILLGKGDGTFNPAMVYDVSGNAGLPGSIATIDFNSDGAPDLAVGVSNGVSFLRNTLAITLPALAIRRNGAALSLSWPFPSSGFVLQSKTNLADLGGWLPVLNSTSHIADQLQVIVSPDTTGRYFRLHRP